MSYCKTVLIRAILIAYVIQLSFSRHHHHHHHHHHHADVLSCQPFPITNCRCQQNVTESKRLYDLVYDSYQTRVKELYVGIRHTLDKKIKDLSSSKCAPYKDEETYIRIIQDQCGINQLLPEFYPIWKSKKVSVTNEEVCKIISSEAHVICSKIKKISKCKYEKLMKRLFWKPYKMCVEEC